MAKKGKNTLSLITNTLIAIAILAVMLLFFMDTTTLMEGLENKKNDLNKVLDDAQNKIKDIKGTIDNAKKEVKKNNN